MNASTERKGLSENDQRKMIFLALLKGAMSYREAYIGEEVEAHRKICEEMGRSMIADPKNKVNTAGKQKRAVQKSSGIHHVFVKRVRIFDEKAVKEIEAVSHDFQMPGDDSFNNYVQGFGEMMFHYIQSKSTADIISVCEAYNAGLLDDVLTIIKQAAIDKAEETAEKIIKPLEDLPPAIAGGNEKHIDI